jgi:GGDEF-like domain
VILIVQPSGDGGADAGVWQAMHRAIKQTSPDGVGSIGIGGLAPELCDIPRTYRQARQALRIRSASFVGNPSARISGRI